MLNVFEKQKEACIGYGACTYLPHANAARRFLVWILEAWLLERTNIPFKVLLYVLVPLPMIVPGMLSAIAWILLLSPRIGVINLVIKNILGLEKSR